VCSKLADRTSSMEIRRFRADLCDCLFAMGDKGWTNIVECR
jgi:hypothetical protein